jgi:hypothetical protein
VSAALVPDFDELPPEDPDLAALEAEAEAMDAPGTSARWANATADERPLLLADAAAWRSGLRDSLERAGFDSAEEYLAAIDPDRPTWRTLADVSDAPPAPLLFGWLEDAPTLAYAAPGVGKGTTGAWTVCEALGAGMRPAIFDAERRPREWARRVSGLGGDRSRVVYLEPTDLGTKLAGRPFWEQAEDVARVLRAAGCDLFLLDSLLPASGIGEDRLKSDAQAPFLFVSALEGLGLPSLAFGHPPKGQPEGDPFGSMAWLAAFRLTWLGTSAEGDGHRVRWRPRKRNERGHIPGFLLTVAYGDDGRPCSVERADDDENTRDWILGGLVSGPRSMADLAEELLGEAENPPAGELDRIKERLGRALRRMAREGWVEKIGSKGPSVRWVLRVRP